MQKVDDALNIANEDNLRLATRGVNKLLRVALINSYPKGQSHLIEVGDNTIITGRNSAGKTTLMGAVIPFFGTRLSEVSKKNEAVKSFIDFYLPYDDSYLVYEYRRQGEKKCVILRRSSEGQQIFNFINTGYNEAWFVTKDAANQRRFRQFEEVKSIIESQGFNVSNNIKQLAYEAIISNCPNRRLKASIRSSKAIQTINALRPDYSLAVGRGSFYGFSLIASNILKSKIEFDQICEFLVEAMKTENKVQNNEISIDSQGVDTNKWLSDRSSWNEVEQLRSKFDELGQYVEQNASNQNALSITVKTFKGLVKAFDTKIAENKTVEVDLKLKIEAIDQAITKIEIAWDKEKGQLQNEIDDLSSKVVKLERAKRDFEYGLPGHHQPLAILQNMIREISSLEEQIKHENKRLKALRKGEEDATKIIESIKNQLTDDLKQIESNKARLASQQELTLQQIKTGYYESLSNLGDDKAAKLNLIKKEYEIKSSAIKEKHTQLIIDKNNLESELKNIRCSLELNKEMESLKLNLDNAKTQLNQDIKNQRTAEKHLDENSKEYEKLQREHERLLNDIANKTSDIDDLYALLKDDTLLSFLLRNESDELLSPLINQIRKTIDPSLFNRSDLSPQWLAPKELDDEALYGLYLDTSKIDTTNNPKKLLTLESITEQRLVLEDEILERRNNISSLEKTIHQAKLNKKKANEDVYRANTNVVNTEKDIENKQATQKQLEIRAENEIEEAKRKIDSQLNEIKNKIDDQISASETVDTKMNSTEQEIASHHKLAIEQLEEDKKKREQAVKQQYVKELEGLKFEANQSQERHDRAINENGYDDNVIAQTIAKVQQLSTKLDVAEKAKIRVKHYHEFIDEEYRDLPMLFEKRNDLSIELVDKQAASDKALISKQEDAKSLAERAKDINGRIESAQTDLISIKESLSNASNAFDQALVVDHTLEPEYKGHSLQDLHNTSLAVLNDAKSLVSDTKKNMEKGIYALKTIRKPFTTNGSMFESLMSDSILLSIPDQENWYIQARKFSDYLNNEHEIKKDTLIGQYRVTAHQVREFKSKLDDAHNSLSNFSKRINTKCKEVCEKLEALAIEELHIAISSGIKENKWYSTLADFTDAHQRWANEDIHDTTRMPNQELLSKLQLVQDYIGQNQMNIKLSEQFSFSLRIKQVGGETKETKRAKVFKDMGSNGTMRIAQLIIYISLLSVISTTSSDEVELKFFIDEIGVLDPQNTRELLNLLQKLGISAMCAAPENPDDEVVPLFANNIACHHNKTRNMYSISQTDDMYMLTQDSELEEFGVFS